MTRGSRFSSILTWFREGDIDEVRAILPLVNEAVAARTGEDETPARATRSGNGERSAAARKAWRTRRANAAANSKTAAEKVAGATE